MFGKSLFNHLEHLRLQLVSVQFLMIPIAYGIQCRAVHILTFSHCDARLGVMTESNLECDKDIQCILTQRASDETRACPVRFLHSQKLIATTASISTTTTMGPCHNHPAPFWDKEFWHPPIAGYDYRWAFSSISSRGTTTLHAIQIPYAGWYAGMPVPKVNAPIKVDQVATIQSIKIKPIADAIFCSDIMDFNRHRQRLMMVTFSASMCTAHTV